MAGEQTMIGAASFTTNDQRWQALVSRKRHADGLFLYGVKTTGVYCRPACSSRLPNRNNVRFFSTWADAERSGYRACKKCQPKSTRSVHVPEAVVRACQMIEAAERLPSLAELAAAVGLSEFYFHRRFKQVVGVTPKAYAAAQRIERLRVGLRQRQPITQAIFGAGFVSSSRCYESAADNLGMTPSDYKKGGAGQTIRFALAECYLGWLLVAATDRGICMIQLADTPDCLRSELATRFPEAELRENESDFREWVDQVVTFIEASDDCLQLPLDIQGTAFQRRVWEALQAIPAGATTTYSEIAAQIGRPSAVRAVARACAANELAIAVPCHRVVRADGHLSGYRWGIERKKALLAREAAHTNPKR
jgi:AraC family transcriptional regulator, regulatory protein of adaptative response / methylated-DNA-[protein]-cysteine methyltransferase